MGGRLVGLVADEMRFAEVHEQLIAGERREAGVDVVVAGGHGQIARRLLGLLARDGHRARGLIRSADQVADLEAVGAEAVLADLEHDDLAAAVAGADAVVFAAGAGPGSGPERKRTVDRDGAVKLLDAARKAGIMRYVLISSMGADANAEDDGGFGAYLRAKGEAEDAVRAAGIAHTIVRPGHLTDAPGTGYATAGASLPEGDISRDDVATTLYLVIEGQRAVGETFDLIGGDDLTIGEALDTL